MRVGVGGLALALAAGVALAAPGPRANYLERCGGCHGVDGRAFAATVPDLKDKAGWFLCDPAGRDYVARLPNVAFAPLSDADMAAMLNYVAFDLGGASAPPGARPFAPAEVARTRRAPLTIPDLESFRTRIIAGLVARCGAPPALGSDYQTATSP